MKKISKIVWFKEVMESLPSIQKWNGNNPNIDNDDSILIKCSFKKPKTNAKKIKITVEDC